MPPVIGLDFGTTNSAIAVADAGKAATLASFIAGRDTSRMVHLVETASSNFIFGWLVVMFCTDGKYGQDPKHCDR
jgi:molecular chaperone DnaK (HSP70)